MQDKISKTRTRDELNTKTIEELRAIRNETEPDIKTRFGMKISNGPAQKEIDRRVITSLVEGWLK